MIQINQLKLHIDHTKTDLEKKIRKILQLKQEDQFSYEILKRSIDARKKPDIFYVYSLGVKTAKESQILKKIHNPSVMIYKEKHYHLPDMGEKSLTNPPVIVGAGPAGLFCAYLLTKAGYAPIVIERGKPVEERQKDVEKFWETGVLDPTSNVQFGEGGAGTFSDGKLNTVVKDPSGRNQFVLQTFVEFGAPEHILYENKPHIGTDILSKVISNIRNYLIEKGAKFYFETKATDFILTGNKVSQVLADKQNFKSQAVVLALGHSARDTFEVLKKHEIPMEAKNFAVGFRVEHPQSMINEYMYGKAGENLPASPYKVTSNFPNGRGVYSFCMCPGGYVVNSSSEEGGLVVNGMSYSGRNGANANSAIIVSVTEKDFGSSDALAGMYYQRKLEQENFLRGNGKIPQQLLGDYRENRLTKEYGSFSSQTKGQTVFADLRGLMSEDMETSFLAGMEHFDKIIPGFNKYDAILSGMETRTSSPVRIIRDENLESSVEGIYPCGEGAGYAGGIMSAAMDGLKSAEAIIKKYRPSY